MYEGYKRKSSLIHSYNITIEDYDRMLEEQDFCCKLCGSIESGRETSNFLYVDHNHDTGEVRGLLCHSCNSLLVNTVENVIKDGIFKKILAYLEHPIYVEPDEKPQSKKYPRQDGSNGYRMCVGRFGCGIEHPVSEFGTRKEKKKDREGQYGPYYRPMCNEGRRWENMYRRYRMTKDTYYSILDRQNNKCAICEVNEPDTWHIDHDHNSDKVRGLLCSPCNMVKVNNIEQLLVTDRLGAVLDYIDY